MPIVNGIDVLVRVKDLYRMANQQSGEQLLRQDQEEQHILRPLISYVSQFSYTTLKTVLEEGEEAECYIEKPFPFKDMVSLLRLLYIV